MHVPSGIGTELALLSVVVTTTAALGRTSPTDTGLFVVCWVATRVAGRLLRRWRVRPVAPQRPPAS